MTRESREIIGAIALAVAILARLVWICARSACVSNTSELANVDDAFQQFQRDIKLLEGPE